MSLLTSLLSILLSSSSWNSCYIGIHERNPTLLSPCCANHLPHSSHFLCFCTASKVPKYPAHGLQKRIMQIKILTTKNTVVSDQSAASASDSSFPKVPAHAQGHLMYKSHTEFHAPGFCFCAVSAYQLWSPAKGRPLGTTMTQSSHRNEWPLPSKSSSYVSMPSALPCVRYYTKYLTEIYQSSAFSITSA